MARSMAWTVAVLTAWLSAAPAAAPAVRLNPPMEIPRAGIAIAVPAGFKPRPLTTPYDLLRAVIEEAGKPVQSVTLSAFPVTGKATAEEFADAKLRELRRNLAVRKLKVLKRVPISVAGVKGMACTMTYTFRGVQSTAAQVYFLREDAGGEYGLCYLLTVVCSADRQGKLLPTLGAVLKSIRLTTVRHPSLPADPEFREPTRDVELGYAIRPPVGWYAEQGEVGMETGQVDYLLGGEPMPVAQLVVSRAAGEARTAEACSKKYLGVARSVAHQRKQTIEVASEGPTTLGTLKAHQFVLTQTSPAAQRDDNGQASVVVIQRTACLQRPGEDAPRIYLLILTAPGKDHKAAGAFMDKLAAGFQAIEPADTQPATRPTTAPTTAPTTD